MLILMFFIIRLLVSGSDDFNIIVWEALKYKLGCKINSGHSGNIFSVKVSPDSMKHVSRSLTYGGKRFETFLLAGWFVTLRLRSHDITRAIL